MDKHKDKTETTRSTRSVKWYHLVLTLLLFTLALEVYEWRIRGEASWAVIVFALILTAFWLLWRKYPSLQKLIGEYGGTQRKRIHGIVYYYGWIIVFVPFSVYLLTVQTDGSVSPAVQVSLIAVAPTLGGLVLAAGSNIKHNPQRRSDLIRVAQKLISATILFVLFAPFFYMVDLLHGIDVNSFKPFEVAAWFRGLYFWLATVCFFGGLILFLWGLADFVFALVDLNDGYQETPNDLKVTVSQQISGSDTATSHIEVEYPGDIPSEEKSQRVDH